LTKGLFPVILGHEGGGIASHHDALWSPQLIKFVYQG
jgi:hypothetical protein